MMDLFLFFDSQRRGKANMQPINHYVRRRFTSSGPYGSQHTGACHPSKCMDNDNARLPIKNASELEDFGKRKIFLFSIGFVNCFSH